MTSTHVGAALRPGYATRCLTTAVPARPNDPHDEPEDDATAGRRTGDTSCAALRRVRR